MCESYKLRCECGKAEADIFFGKMLLNQTALQRLYCPECSSGQEIHRDDRVWDNGWLLELDMASIGQYRSTFGLQGDRLTADWVFDHGYITWVGITPDETERRNRERAEIQELAATDMKAYFQAMKEWGQARESRLAAEGWRKMR